jgi:uncharacterized membrane protein
MLLYFVIVVVALIAFGVWRRFGPIQWIWLLFGIAIVMLILWLLMMVLVVGPEMRRMNAPGG